MIQCQTLDPRPNKPSLPPPRSRPWPRGELSPPAMRSQVLSLFAFVAGCQGKNYLQDSFCSLVYFRPDTKPLKHTEPDKAGPLSQTE